MTLWREIAGEAGSGLLLVADHASAEVPPGLDLGVTPGTMTRHVAVDIGVAPLAHLLCAALGCPGVLGRYSRLVVDLNREEDAPGLIAEVSDGDAIPANAGLDAVGRAQRVDRYWRPYHRHLSELIATSRPNLLISLHSFTPRLRDGRPRPWDVGILYNRDERAARIALPLLAAAGVAVGDNEPYSGRDLNATMNRHGEANGIAYLGIEVRQDRIADAAGQAHWCGVLATVVGAVVARLG